MTDPFSFTLALGPLAVYLILIGLVQCTRRPLVTTGWQDTVALAIGVSGLLMAGPLNLFFPYAAYGIMGWIVWLLLAAFFCLSLLLIVLTMRPRVVVYGATIDQIREPLLKAAQSLDSDARMEGEQVWFPSIGTGVRLDRITPPDVPQIVPLSNTISPVFWGRLVRAFRQELGSVSNESTAKGVALLVIGLLIIGVVGVQIASQPTEMLAGFREWLRL